VESAEEYRMNHLNEAEEMIPDYAARVPPKNGQGLKQTSIDNWGSPSRGEALLTLGECLCELGDDCPVGPKSIAINPQPSSIEGKEASVSRGKASLRGAPRPQEVSKADCVCG